MPDCDHAVHVEVRPDHVAVIEFERGPNNFLTAELVAEIAGAYETIDHDPGVRAIVLASAGRHFCGGVDFGADRAENIRQLYAEAVRLFANTKPVVAAVQGAAVGGGLGLALSADLRVVGPDSRLTANFARLGIHHGFGMSVTLPRVVGHQHTLDLLYRGHRLDGAEAHRIGLADRLANGEEPVRAAAISLAADIAASAPLAIRSIRATLRGGLAAEVREATQHELSEQLALFATDDFSEGIRAAAARETPMFVTR